MANLEAEDQTLEESEDMSSDGEVTEDFDSVDGLKNFITKTFSKFASRIRIKKRSSPDSSIPTRDFSATRDFSEGKDQSTISDPENKQDLENDIYKFNYPKRGLALIIDNEHFKKTSMFSDRPGSSYDLSSLRKTFKRLGFDVMMFKNLSSNSMYQTLMTVSQDYDHAAADCFVCVILSHGHEVFIQKGKPGSKSDVCVRQDIIFGVNGKALTTEKILNFFNDFSCPGLVGKPRLFFFQACRGENLDEGVDYNVIKKRRVKSPRKTGRDAQDSLNPQVTGPDSQIDFTDALRSDDEGEGNVHGVESDETDARSGEQTPVVVTPAPLYKDCLVMYATPPGHYAWRRTSGSWFIESLTQVLNYRETRRKSLMNALVMVCRLVAQNYESYTPSTPEMHQKKEMPVIQSMLLKDVVMTKKVNNQSYKCI